MKTEERSLKVYTTQKTFFTKIGSTFSRLLSPTQIGINNFLLNMRRNTMLKNFKNIDKAKESKKEAAEKKFEETYNYYLDSVDQLIIESIYKKVRENRATDFEKDALSNYYTIIHLKENDEIEYKYRKQQYLLDLDMNSIRETSKAKLVDNYTELYLKQMEQLYKGLLKHYSMKLSEKMTNLEKDELYNKIFDALESYVETIIPLKEITDEDLIKDLSLYETYEVGKLDRVDILDKKMILLAMARKLFIHSLPLIVAERCYIRLMKETRALIVDTKIIRKRENAYQLLLRMFEQYNERLLKVKIYWNNNDDKKSYNKLVSELSNLEVVKKEEGTHKYEVEKQILYILEDMRYLLKFGLKYNKIIEYYKTKLVNLGYMIELPNRCKTLEGRFEKVYGKVKENEQAC